MEPNLDFKYAVLGYLSVLNVKKYNDKLTDEEKKFGGRSICGCLFKVEDELTKQSDQTSLSLVEKINERETINGQTPDVKDKRLVEVTEDCAKSVFDYYVQRFR